MESAEPVLQLFTDAIYPVHIDLCDHPKRRIPKEMFHLPN